MLDLTASLQLQDNFSKDMQKIIGTMDDFTSMTDEITSAADSVQRVTGDMIDNSVSKDFSDASKSLNDFAGASDNVTGSAGGIAGMIDTARDSVNKLSDAIRNIPKINDQIGSFGMEATKSFAPVTGFFGAALGGGLNRMSQMEDAQRMIEQMVGGGAAFDRVMKGVTDLADDTSYLYSEVASMIGGSLGREMSEADAQMLANVSMELGAFKGDKQIGLRLNEMFGQAFSRGTIDGDLTNRLSEIGGIQVWDVLGEALGTSADQAAKMVNEGAIPMEEALRHLSDDIMENFEGSMIKYAESLPGLISNTWAALGSLGQSMIGEDGFERLKEGIQGVIDTLYELAPVFEPIGNQIMNVMADLADVASNVVKWVLDLPGPVKSVLAYFSLFLGVIGPIALGFHALVKAGLLVGKMFMMVGKSVLWFGKAFLGLSKFLLLNPFGLILTGVTLLGVGIYQLVKHWDTVTEKITEFWDKLQSTLSVLREGEGAIATFAGVIQEYLNYAVTQAVTLWEYLQDVFQMGADFFRALFSGDFAQAFEILGDIWERTKELAAELWDNMLEAAQEILDILVPWVEEKFEEMKDAVVEWLAKLAVDGIAKFIEFKDGAIEKVEEFWNDLVEWFKGLPEMIGFWIGYAVTTAVTFFQELPGRIGEILDQLREWATDKLTTFAENVAEWFTKTRDDATTTMSELPGRIYDFFYDMGERAVGKMKEFASDMKEWFKQAYDNSIEWIQQLPDKIASFLESIPGKVRGAISNIKSAFRNLGSQMIEGIKSGITTAVSKLTGAVKWVFETASNGWSALTDFGGNMVNNVTRGFGRGSAEATSAYHGEAYVPRNNAPYMLHKGERVLTRDENKAYSNGMQGATVNFPNAVFHVREDADIDKIGNAVAQKLMKASNGGVGAHA
ncbi:tape measure protein [Geomicrobium sediminis]|uniref:Tape measure domain-containing protein n=1 Tax=Geomicrobium sediminis TaxID=1347788 RepID=A0ABS2PHZ0_9BACL|nr:tape measure protein [Geomicrobium sediminis]MBM7634949.1 tape measure domain-containing protein [Geomicrobium sediminis]